MKILISIILISILFKIPGSNLILNEREEQQICGEKVHQELSGLPARCFLAEIVDSQKLVPVPWIIRGRSIKNTNIKKDPIPGKDCRTRNGVIGGECYLKISTKPSFPYLFFQVFFSKILSEYI
jgi:hypothetical protein